MNTLSIDSKEFKDYKEELKKTLKEYQWEIFENYEQEDELREHFEPQVFEIIDDYFEENGLEEDIIFDYFEKENTFKDKEHYYQEMTREEVINELVSTLEDTIFELFSYSDRFYFFSYDNDIEEEYLNTLENDDIKRVYYEMKRLFKTSIEANNEQDTFLEWFICDVIGDSISHSINRNIIILDMDKRTFNN